MFATVAGKVKFEHATKDKKRIRVDAVETDRPSDAPEHPDRSRRPPAGRWPGTDGVGGEQPVKPDIHPKYYQAKVHCGSCGTEWTVGSTRTELRVDVCAQLPPVLHGHAEHHRHGRPGRALPEAPGAPGPELAPAIRPSAGPIGRRPLVRERPVDFRRMPTLHLRRSGPDRGRPDARPRRHRRRPAPSRTGSIVYATERLDAGFHGTRWSKMPFIRGLVVLYETLVMGTRWLVRSANVQAAGGRRRARQGLGRADARPDARGRRRDLLPAAAAHRQRHDRQRRERPRPAPRRGPGPGRHLPRLSRR